MQSRPPDQVARPVTEQNQSGTEQPEGQQIQTLQALYQRYLEPVYRYIYSKVANREEAEDLTAQTFMKAARTIDYTRSSYSIQKWLFQIARTTIADYWRAYYRISLSSLDELLEGGWEGPAAEGQAISSMTPVDHVQQILARLSEQYREVLTCRFLLNLSIKETAAKLGLSEANVKVLQFRALKHAAQFDAGTSARTHHYSGE